MRYAEYLGIDLEARTEFLAGLSPEDCRDLNDQEPYQMTDFHEKPGRLYFDTPAELHDYLAQYYVPEAKLWRADEIAAHEAAHGECAMAAGALYVKYSVNIDPKVARSPIFTHPQHGANEVPNLVATAISAHPYTSWTESRVDRADMLGYGYDSREFVAERIRRWNEQGFGIHLPEPETQEKYLGRLARFRDNR